MGHEELESSIETKPTLPIKEEKPEEEKIGFFERIARSRKVGEIIKSNGRRQSALMHILQDIQQEFNYLPQDILELVSSEINIPLSQIYSTAAFYDSFHLKPRGKHIVSVCMGTACHVRGSHTVLESLEDKLKIHAGETTSDLGFTLESVNCLGACALGPVAVLDGKYHGNLDTQKAKKIIHD
jgi:NADH-quinone oxidoreductase subunit E